MQAAPILAIILVGVAGCLRPQDSNVDQPANGGDHPTPEDYPTIDLGPDLSKNPRELPVNRTSLPVNLDLNNCDGWSSTVDMPGALVPTVAFPQGWEENQLPTHRVTLNMYQCEQIGWGKFERGPITLLVDYVGPENIPQACREWQNDWDLPGVIHGFWTDDLEIAAELRNLTGMPASGAEIEVTVEAGLPSTARLTWSVEGESSFLEFQSLGPDPNDIEMTYRLIWPQGERLFFLDLTRNDAAHEGSFITRGKVEPPLLFSAMPMGNIVATSSWLLPTPIEGRFSVFEDSQCAQPIT